jgi:signal transduction histidine kinase
MNVLRLKTARARLLGLLAATIGGLVVVVIGVWIFNIEPALRQSVAMDQRKAAMHAADLISNFIDERISDLRAAAQIGHLWQTGHDHRKESVYQLMKVVPAIRELAIVGPGGDEAIRVSRTRTFADTDLRSLSTADKFRQPMRGETYIGPVYHEQTAEPFITLAVPIGSSAAEIQGVLVAEINLKTLWNVVSHIKVGRSGYLYVVSGTGQLIAHHDYSKVVLGTNLGHVPEVQEFLREPDSDPGFGDVEAGYGGPRVMTTYALVPKPHWGVIVEESIDTAFADAYQLKLLAEIILGLAVLAVFAVSYRFSRRLTEPIRQLEKGAERIAQGELDYRLDIRTGDEIEQLADKFNRMAAALKESHSGLEAKIADRTKDISALYAAIAPLKPADSLAQTLDHILVRLREATGADAARVRLWNERQEVFFTPAANGFDTGATGASETPGQLPAQDEVFRQNRAMVIPELAKDPRIKRKKLISGGFHSAAFLPLTVGGKTIGVVQLVSRTEGYFKPEKENHLIAIARQMGIAMENRELFDQTQRHLDRIHALHDIDVAIAQSLDLKKILDVLLEKIEVFLPIPAVYSVKLFNSENGRMEPAACRNLDEAEWKALVQRRSQHDSEPAFDGTAPRIIRNVQADRGNPRQPFFIEHSLVSYLGVPLTVKDELLGVLGLYTREEHDFTAEEIDFFMTLAGQAAIAINNSQLYEQIRKQTTELISSNRIKDEFLGVMSHELRTPLSVIAGYANLLADETFGKISPEQMKATRVIKDRSDALGEMVTNILEAAKLASGAIAATVKEVNVASLLAALKDQYAHRKKDSVALNWEMSPDLPEIVTDGGKLQQILKKLLDNALKFTEAGTVTISANLAERKEQSAKRAEFRAALRDTSNQSAIRNPQSEIRNRDTSNEIRAMEFTVRDTGIGITSEAIQSIFEKFRQGDSSETRSYEGAGLGLFIVKKFTELLGGEVHVESEPGRGSTFTVTLPCVAVSSAAGVGAWNGLPSASPVAESPLI